MEILCFIFILVTAILGESKLFLKNHQMDSARNEITNFRGDIIDLSRRDVIAACNCDLFILISEE